MLLFTSLENNSYKAMMILCHSLFQTFRRLLLNKCQDEFENRSKTYDSFDTENGLTEDEMEQRLIAKHKMLGNIKFIGK